MTGLRWFLGITAGVIAAGWLLLTVAGNSFRGSFGASENSALKTIAPTAIALLLLAALIWPERRLLLYLGGLAAVGILIASLFLARATVFVAGCGVIYTSAWLYFYYRMLRK